MGRLTPEMLAAGAMFPRMNGRQVFKHATTRFPEVILESLEKAGERLEDAKLVIPHQANKRIGDAIAERLGIPPEKVFQNIQRYGNTTAASVPIALSEARAAGLIERGDLVVLAAFGAGFALPRGGPVSAGRPRSASRPSRPARTRRDATRRVRRVRSSRSRSPP
jgi:3-oxoacyl-[acyl-carrier-protein] synthase-3